MLTHKKKPHDPDWVALVVFVLIWLIAFLIKAAFWIAVIWAIVMGVDHFFL